MKPFFKQWKLDAYCVTQKAGHFTSFRDYTERVH